MTREGTLRPALFWAIVAVFTLVAFALRWAGAGGPLWLDELVSVGFVTGDNGPNGLFTVHDNNHFLNTVWLWLVGPDAPVRLQRGLAIVLGVAAVPLAAVLMRRRGDIAGLATAAIFATATPLVVYGSDARGYAGLVAATLVLFIAADRHLHDDRPAARWLAAAATGVGFAFQPLTAIGCLAMAVTVFAVHWRRGHGFDGAMTRSLRFLAPSMAVGLVLVGLIALQAARTGMAVGGLVPFSPARFFAGYADFVGGMLGLPPSLPRVLAPLAGLVLTAVAARRPAIDSDLPMLAAGLVIAPLAFFALMPPNTEMARYHIDAGLFAVIALVLAGRALWRAGDNGKRAAALVAAGWIGLQAASNGDFLSSDRGQIQPLLAEAAAGLPQPVTVATGWPQLVAYYLAGATRTTGVAYRLVDRATACDPAPDVLVEWVGDTPAASIEGPDAPCAARYEVVGRTHRYWLVGMDFVVFRRAP